MHFNYAALPAVGGTPQPHFLQLLPVPMPTYVCLSFEKSFFKIKYQDTSAISSVHKKLKLEEMLMISCILIRISLIVWLDKTVQNILGSLLSIGHQSPSTVILYKRKNVFKVTKLHTNEVICQAQACELQRSSRPHTSREIVTQLSLLQKYFQSDKLAVYLRNAQACICFMHSALHKHVCNNTFKQ